MGKGLDIADVGLIGLTGLSALRGASELSKIKSGANKFEQDKKRIEAKEDKEESRENKEPTGYGKESLSKERTYKKGGSVSSASKRADGIAVRGKTKGRMV